ncbi:NlpC/P60 family protein [uncultured Vibrio sp.]|uniref:NlpC/P60 family protein n=1 Tax=uncultured Vibrio sp. TaxID=114054 RepID=UPI0025D5A263|nr:NlpC/P60 family protein [uncultured Vibrio sp.]
MTTSTSTNATGYSSQLTHQEEKTKSSFLSVYNRWEGVPYRLGGNTFQGIDCSAFVQIAYRDALSVDLPRTTLHQSKVGWSINYNDAEVGDLVFFRTSRTTRHVGVYLGDRQFLHASTSRGVIISRVDNPYWASKFWHFRRVTNSPKIN